MLLFLVQSLVLMSYGATFHNAAVFQWEMSVFSSMPPASLPVCKKGSMSQFSACETGVETGQPDPWAQSKFTLAKPPHIFIHPWAGHHNLLHLWLIVVGSSLQPNRLGVSLFCWGHLLINTAVVLTALAEKVTRAEKRSSFPCSHLLWSWRDQDLAGGQHRDVSWEKLDLNLRAFGHPQRAGSGFGCRDKTPGNPLLGGSPQHSGTASSVPRSAAFLVLSQWREAGAAGGQQAHCCPAEILMSAASQCVAEHRMGTGPWGAGPSECFCKGLSPSGADEAFNFHCLFSMWAKGECSAVLPAEPKHALWNIAVQGDMKNSIMLI